MSTENEFETVTAKEICSQFKIAERTLYDWCKGGIFPKPIISGRGRTRKWLKSDVRAAIDKARSAAA